MFVCGSAKLSAGWKTTTAGLLLSLSATALAQYDQPPQAVKIGEAGTIAAYPPPHELKADPRILDTLTKEIFLQQGDEFGVVDGKNQPLKPVPTNDWWSDLIMNGDGGLMWQLPMTPKIAANFIEIRAVGGIRPNSHGGGRETIAPLRVGGWNGDEAAADPKKPPMQALEKARATAWSDWMVGFRKTSAADAKKFVDVTMPRCMPYVWFDVHGMDALLNFDPATAAYFDGSGKEIAAADLGSRDTLAIRIDGRYYGIHVAEGTTFRALASGGVVVKLPENARFLVVSALPGLEHLSTFAKCAYAKPTKTIANYRYDAKSADATGVKTRWSYEVQALRPGADTVLQGWLAPHYRETKNDLAFIPGADFETPRGKLRCATAKASVGFSVEYPFNGVLSHMAAPRKTGLPNDFDVDYIRGLLTKYDADSDGVAGDTYFGAKRLVLHARAMHMAKELGQTESYQNLKAEIQASLADWFTYKDGEENHYFARNDRWGSLIGFNFVRDFNLGRFTDIHFHYGYYVLAYAYVAMDDPEFRDKYKEIAIELARAYAEWDKQSKRYPWMRTFEPMVGHSYAGGSGSSGGNNQESSSESIQAWAALFLLGESLRGNDSRADEILAAGAFGYAIETRAVLEYYQDYHGSPAASAPLDYDNKPAVGDKRYPIWPDEFRNGRTVPGYPDHKAVVYTNGIMGDGGNTFATYFGANAEYVYGIQWLPNAPHMLFLAHDPEFTLGQFTALMAYRDEHYAISWLNSVLNAPRNLRNEWHKKGNDRNPDPRAFAVDNPWSGADMKGLVQNLYKLNPAFVKDISREGDPQLDNPFYDEKAKKWLIEFPSDKPDEVVFPKQIWTADYIAANYPHLVPPKTEAELANYSLQKWVTNGFMPPKGVGVDWKQLSKSLSWDPADYPETIEGRKASIAQLTNALETIGGSWPLITLTFAGLADPELGVDVMAESRRRNNRFAEHTETGLFAYYYFYSLRGIGHPVYNQHLSIPSSQVFRNDKTGEYTYMVHNKSNTHEMVDVFENGKRIGQVLAAPNSVTVQKKAFTPSVGFAAIGTIPAQGESSVSLVQDKLVIVFSEPVDPASVETAVQLTGPGQVKLQYVAGGSPQVATYRVIGNWVPGTQYTVTVPAGTTNLAKSAKLDKPMQFSFNTAKLDGCRIMGTAPAQGATNVSPTKATIAITFNNPVNLASLKDVTITGPGNPTLKVDAAASVGGTAVFVASSSFKPADKYTVTIPAGVTDVYGQALAAPSTISFSTAQADAVLSQYDTVLDAGKFKRVGGSNSRSVPFEGGTRWEFTEVGDFVELSIRADKAGTYRASGTAKEFNLRGVVTLTVNGVRAGGEWNQFDGNGLVTFDFGNVELVEGENKLRFELAAANPANKDKPWFVLRDMTFVPAAK